MPPKKDSKDKKIVGDIFVPATNPPAVLSGAPEPQAQAASPVAKAKRAYVRKPKAPAVDAGLAAAMLYKSMKDAGMKRGSYKGADGQRIVRAGELKAPKVARHMRDAKGAFRKVKEADEEGNVISHIVADYGLSALKAMKAMANKEKRYKGKEAVAELRSYKKTVKDMRSEATSKTTQARVAAESAKTLRAEAKDLRKKAKEMMEAGKAGERQAFSPAGLARYVSDSDME